jgi:hypothetical protein
MYSNLCNQILIGVIRNWCDLSEISLIINLILSYRQLFSEIKCNSSVKDRKGSGGSSVKTLKRNLYPLNYIGSFPKSTMQMAGWPICMTSMIALQGFGGRTFRPYWVKYHSVTEKVWKNYILRIGIVPAHRVEWIGVALGRNLWD